MMGENRCHYTLYCACDCKSDLIFFKTKKTKLNREHKLWNCAQTWSFSPGNCKTWSHWLLNSFCLTLSSWHFYIISKWINRKPSGRQTRGDTWWRSWQRSHVWVDPVTSRPRWYLPPSYPAACEPCKELKDVPPCFSSLWLRRCGSPPQDNLWENLPLICCRDSSEGKCHRMFEDTMALLFVCVV